MISFSFCYQTITEESAREGDFADHGFLVDGFEYSMNNEKTLADIRDNPQDYEIKWEQGNLLNALQIAENLGVCFPSSWPAKHITSNDWFNSESTMDMYSGEDREYSFRIRGVTDATMKRIYKLLVGKNIFEKL